MLIINHGSFCAGLTASVLWRSYNMWGCNFVSDRVAFPGELLLWRWTWCSSAWRVRVAALHWCDTLHLSWLFLCRSELSGRNNLSDVTISSDVPGKQCNHLSLQRQDSPFWTAAIWPIVLSLSHSKPFDHGRNREISLWVGLVLCNSFIYQATPASFHSSCICLHGLEMNQLYTLSAFLLFTLLFELFVIYSIKPDVVMIPEFLLSQYKPLHFRQSNQYI